MDHNASWLWFNVPDIEWLLEVYSECCQRLEGIWWYTRMHFWGHTWGHTLEFLHTRVNFCTLERIVDCILESVLECVLESFCILECELECVLESFCILECIFCTLVVFLRAYLRAYSRLVCIYCLMHDTWGNTSEFLHTWLHFCTLEWIFDCYLRATWEYSRVDSMIYTLEGILEGVLEDSWEPSCFHSVLWKLQFTFPCSGSV